MKNVKAIITLKCIITNHPSSFPHSIFFKFHISLQQSLPIFTI